MKNIKIVAITLLFLSISACDTEYLDPNSILEPAVTGDADNLVRLINGIQQRWSTDRAGITYNYTHISGLNTGELRLLNPGNDAEAAILGGGNQVDGGNGILNTMWTNSMLCRKEATTVINSADGASGGDTGVANSLKAYGLFYRALVNGTLIQIFEQIPLEIVDNSPFENRATVLQSAIADLEEANGYVSSGLAASVTSGVFDSVDLGNAINALLARFNLIAGNYQAAINAANQVSLAATSEWAFDAALPNPLAFWFGSQNVTQARDFNFALPEALQPDLADGRINFYVTAENPDDPFPDFQVAAFYDDNLDRLPVYLPGEMLLIKAEAYARSDDLVNAVNELNAVLTKTAAQDAFGIGAGLPAYSGANTQEAILDEIYRNRRIELYLSGLGLEDSRRFGRPGPGAADAERNRNFYPYPDAERDNNDNIPANPTS